MVDISVPELSVGILLLVMLFMRYTTAQVGGTIDAAVWERGATSPPEGMVLISEGSGWSLWGMVPFVGTVVGFRAIGKFWMGSEDVNSDSDERPVHRVRLRWFFMDTYAVTSAQYRAFVDANPQWQKDNIPDIYHDGDYLKHWNGNDYPSLKEQHPVVYISWYAAMAYAQWADKRLPTEAEWEAAARGGLKQKKYFLGDQIASTQANYGKNVGTTRPVESYRPNQYGLYNICGNVWEWTFDVYEADFYKRSPRKNPIAGGTTPGDFTKHLHSPRVCRGGSWASDSRDVRVAYRNWAKPTLTRSDYGFRCVKDLNFFPKLY